MLDKIVPKKIKHLIDLIRLDKPIGFLLLMWPCWFALANLPQDNAELTSVSYTHLRAHET